MLIWRSVIEKSLNPGSWPTLLYILLPRDIEMLLNTVP